MPAHAPLLNTVHLLLTAGFVVVTFALLGISVVNRLRIRNVVIAWRPVSWHAYPVGPILFGALLVGFEVVAILSGRTIPAFLLIGYGSGTVAWFAAAYLSSVVIVSDCGVVADIHRSDLAISWGQVTDYFEFERGRRNGFVFLFKGDDGTPRRMEVDVPRRLMPLLREHISRRLSARFEPVPSRDSGKRVEG